jgi:hypothetical protein
MVWLSLMISFCCKIGHSEVEFVPARREQHSFFLWKFACFLLVLLLRLRSFPRFVVSRGAPVHDLRVRFLEKKQPD